MPARGEELRVVRRADTAAVQRNIFICQGRVMFRIDYMRHANFVKHVDPYANMVVQPDEYTASLIHPTGKPLEEEWQGRLSRAGTGR